MQAWRKNRTIHGKGAAPLAVAFLLAAVPARSDRVENGNDLALRFQTASPGQRQIIASEAAGKPFFFRYLRIQDAARAPTNGAPSIRFRTREPSSDVPVDFCVTKEESLRKADPLKAGESVAVTGRIKAMDPSSLRIILDPVIVRYRDKPAPESGKEMLHELDPNARAGGDTSSGREIILPGKGGVGASK